MGEPAGKTVGVGEGSAPTLGTVSPRCDRPDTAPRVGAPVPTTMAISFESCWAKLDRAKEHRDALDRYVLDAFSVETNRPRIGIRFDADTRQHLLYVSRLPDLRPLLRRVGLCLGDVMHNSRSALDQLTYQLAMWHTGGHVNRPKRVQFPIADVSSHFASARGDALREVHPDHQAIIERFQPYHPISEGRSIGPEFHSLAVLRDLDNADKQRPLSPILIAPTALGAYRGDALTVVRSGLEQTPEWARAITPIAEGAPLIRATLPRPVAVVEAETVGTITPGIGLREGWPIDHVMDRVGALILKVIGAFQLP